MLLPVNPPLLPMLAKRVSALPVGEGFIFEPKWDGFRTLVFRDGDEIFVQSRDEKPLNRYYPEVMEPLKAALPERVVLDGELVIARGGVLDFDALQLRRTPPNRACASWLAEIPQSLRVLRHPCVKGIKIFGEVPFADRRARR